MLETRTGNTLSTESEEAANLYLEAVDLILGSESGAADALDQALDKDPDFALAAAARYYLANDVGEHGADAFRELAERTSLNASDWERTHNEVLLGMIDQLADSRLLFFLRRCEQAGCGAEFFRVC
jgi:hypothetical protein